MISLLTQLFSIKKGSMRAIRLYRIVQVVWLLPLFVFLLVTNNIALALDWVLFPSFKKQEIKNPIFIASLPIIKSLLSVIYKKFAYYRFKKLKHCIISKNNA